MKFADLVAETTTSTSTSVIALAGAKADQRTFASAWPVGTTDIAVYIKSGAVYEFGLYTLTSASQLTRQGGIRSSSNGGSAATFSSGSRDVLNDVPAEFLNSLFSSADTTDVASVPTLSTVPSGAYVLVLGTDGSLSKTLASNLSAPSNGGTTTPSDTTAPTLSSPTATSTGTTTASGTVSTNEASGTLYRYMSANATETVPTVQAANLTSAVSATGVQNVTFTGLTAGTTYYAHYVHRDAAGNDSIVANSGSFTTTAAASAPAYQARTTNAQGQKINGVNYFPDASSSSATMSGTSPNYFTRDNNTFVSVYKTSDGSYPATVKFVWSKSATQPPIVYADTALPANSVNGNTIAYTDAVLEVGLLYGNTYSATPYIRGTPGTYYLWALAPDGGVTVYDNGTGTPIGWTVKAP